jgi:hypothetical protein
MSERRVTDPHGLLESGEELLPLGQLASVIGCSKNALRALRTVGVTWRREPLRRMRNPAVTGAARSLE